MVIHPRENDLVAATYGRGVWIADIAPLQEMSEAVRGEAVHLFDIKPRTQRIYGGLGNYRLLGDSHLFADNEPNAVLVRYALKSKAAGPVKIRIADPYGKVLAEMTGPGEPGLNTVEWSMRVQAAGQGGGPGEEFGYFGGPLVDPGEYVVTLDCGGQTFSKRAVIRGRQGWTLGPLPVVIK
jgi:hypothetical protein